MVDTSIFIVCGRIYSEKERESERVSDTEIIVVCIVVKSPDLCGSLLIRKEIKGRDAVMLSVLAIHATGSTYLSIIVIIIIKIKSPLSVEIFIAPLYLVYTSIRNILLVST